MIDDDGFRGFGYVVDEDSRYGCSRKLAADARLVVVVVMLKEGG